MKLNNKGFSLVELLVAVLVSTIVFGAITALLTFSSRSMRVTSAKIELQNQSKDAINHLESFAMEAEHAIWCSEKNALVIFNDEDDFKMAFPDADYSLAASDLGSIAYLSTNAYIYWQVDNKLYFAKCSTSGSDTIVPADTAVSLTGDALKDYLLADYVEEFKVDVMENNQSGKKILSCTINCKDNVSEYNVNRLIYLRNQ